jgi:hypothetical protein
VFVIGKKAPAHRGFLVGARLLPGRRSRAVTAPQGAWKTGLAGPSRPNNGRFAA